MKLGNLFKSRDKRLEEKMRLLELKFDNLYALTLSLAVIMNIHPQLVKENLENREELYKYLLKLK